TPYRLVRVRARGQPEVIERERGGRGDGRARGRIDDLAVGRDQDVDVPGQGVDRQPRPLRRRDGRDTPRGHGARRVPGGQVDYHVGRQGDFAGALGGDRPAEDRVRLADERPRGDLRVGERLRLP